jgi:allantoate deiminase
LNDAAQVMARCRELARVTDVAGETTRTFLSPAMRAVNQRVAGWMQDAGLTVSTDAAGNLRGMRESQRTGARTLLLASHLDTVPNAGAFDGVLGVMMALAVVETLRETSLPFHVEVIAFSEEEGVRFGTPFLGSRAIVGTLDEDLLQRKDNNHCSVRDAITAYGLDVSDLPDAIVRNPLGYLEFHIEQGPALESEGLPLGVVETIAGQSRYELVFRGEANHAGTTPMALRHDAMSAAAQWIAEVETYARATHSIVATVGSVVTIPGAGNVIAGEVRATLDVRSANDAVREDAVLHLLKHAADCGNSRGVGVDVTLRMQQPAVPMDYNLLTLLEDAVDSTGTILRRMVSGAGHDAMVVAPHMPAAMLFIRTPRGLSHHPDETVLPADVQLGLNAGAAFVRLLAARENDR